MAVAAIYGTGIYGDSRYSVLAVKQMVGSSIFAFDVRSSTKVKRRANASTSLTTVLNATPNMLPFRRTFEFQGVR